MTLATIIEQLTIAQAQKLIESVDVQVYPNHVYYKTGIFIRLHKHRPANQKTELTKLFTRCGHIVSHISQNSFLVQIQELAYTQ